MNLAALPAEERQRIEADKIAHMIRHQVKGMKDRERKEHARAVLVKLDKPIRDQVLKRMGELASANRN